MSWIDRGEVLAIVRQCELAGMAPGLSTSVTHPGCQCSSYLLRGIEVSRPNQVWSTDLTDIRLACGFVYLVAIVDRYRSGGIVRVLQRRAPAPVAGQPDAEQGVCGWPGRRGEYPRP